MCKIKKNWCKVKKMAKNLNLGNCWTISRSNIFRPKLKKINRAVFEKNIKVSEFGLIWRPFHKYLKMKNFFKNPAVWLFYLYSPLTSCKKSEKSLEVFLRKLRYQPTNQPTKASNFGLIWRPFHEYLQIKIFFQKSSSVAFLPLQSLTSCKKSEKSIEPFLRKLRSSMYNWGDLTKNLKINKPNFLIY